MVDVDIQNLLMVGNEQYDCVFSSLCVCLSVCVMQHEGTKKQNAFSKPNGQVI